MKKTVGAVVLFVTGFIMVAYAMTSIWNQRRENEAARTEYDYLRGMSAGIMTKAPLPQIQNDHEEPVEDATEPDEIEWITDPGEGEIDLPPEAYIDPLEESLRAFKEINPDFVGWLSIPGVSIDYPVVRGRDNVRYLDTTFSGSRNPAGAIFMDYRNLDGFDAPVTVLYGHNMRDGSMFAMLVNFLQRVFLEDSPEIFVVTAEGEPLLYRIFEARRTDAWDNVYSLIGGDAETAADFFDKPEGSQFLVLSTCMTGNDRNVRLLVIAVRS
jgi:sortase B